MGTPPSLCVAGVVAVLSVVLAAGADASALISCDWVFCSPASSVPSMIQLESRRMGMRPVVVIACFVMAALKSLSRVAAEDGLGEVVELDGRDNDLRVAGRADVSLRRTITARRQPKGHGSGPSGLVWPAMRDV